MWPVGQKTQFLDEHLSRSPIYDEYINGGKKTVELDLSSEAGRAELQELLGTAHVLVEDWRNELLHEAALDTPSLQHQFPTIIAASITPFGRAGARSDWSASDLTLCHGGGPGFATPGLVADPEQWAPIRLGSHQASFVSGLTAAANICAAAFQQVRDPQRIGMRVDFSCLEAMANVFRQSLGTFAFYGGGLSRDLARGRGAGGTADHRNIRCKDGWINMTWSFVKQWETLKELMGRPAWAEDERLATPELRGRNWAVAVPHIEKWASEYDKQSLFFLCQGNRIPCAPVNGGRELLESEGLSSRSFWDESESGTPLPGIHSQFIGSQW